MGGCCEIEQTDQRVPSQVWTTHLHVIYLIIIIIMVIMINHPEQHDDVNETVAGLKIYPMSSISDTVIV